jgi:hypothetical protein
MARQAEALKMNMELADIPGTSLKVSPVAIGTWAIGGWMWGGTDEAESVSTIRAELGRSQVVMNLAQPSNVPKSCHAHEHVPIRFIHVGRDLDRPSRSRPKIRIRGRLRKPGDDPERGCRQRRAEPLCIVNFLQIGVIADRLDALLKGNYFVVAGHHDHGPKLQTLGKVHGADRNVPAGSFNVLIENLESKARRLYGKARTIQLRR